MSQPRGRYPGSRDYGGRPSRQPSTTSHRQNKPYAKSRPTREAAQTASIFKTRSFKWLVDAVGAENIALGLDSNLSRVAELINGERFTPETAFHIETTHWEDGHSIAAPGHRLHSATLLTLQSARPSVGKGRRAASPPRQPTAELERRVASGRHSNRVCDASSDWAVCLPAPRL
ncbi:hypothetical protein SAMN05443245_7657 [Paraburkholderia fungorum]|uniref:Uncharacterized protein n=1 Tax=Paraburkholderia fungorum TaxID=134537 RepID=A0A1H1K0F5_9BURK|nr:hypothetical protein SAMN05443245_7657 [Paraburkholderia fungorum]